MLNGRVEDEEKTNFLHNIILEDDSGDVMEEED